MMTKYTKMENYEVTYINTNKEVWRFACCDCGLVHTIGALVKGNKHEKRARAKLKKYEVGLVYIREPRSTAQLRRHSYGYLQSPNKKDRYELKRLK